MASSEVAPPLHRSRRCHMSLAMALSLRFFTTSTSRRATRFPQRKSSTPPREFHPNRPLTLSWERRRVFPCSKNAWTFAWRRETYRALYHRTSPLAFCPTTTAPLSSFSRPCRVQPPFTTYTHAHTHTYKFIQKNTLCIYIHTYTHTYIHTYKFQHPFPTFFGCALHVLCPSVP